MPLLVYRPRNFDQTHEREQFRNLCVLLKERFASSPDEMCIFIGNFNIGDVELDGIIIKNDGVVILEFKDYGGSIIATENGDWISVEDGVKTIIKGGSGRKNPYTQAKINRIASKPVFVESGAFSTKEVERISSMIVFHRPSEIDNKVSSRVKWLRICDERSFIDELDLIVSSNCDFQIEDFSRIIDRLALNPDWLCVRYSNVEVLNNINVEGYDEHNHDDMVLGPDINPTPRFEESIIHTEIQLSNSNSLDLQDGTQQNFVSYMERVFSALGISDSFEVFDVKNNSIPSWVNLSQLTNEFLVVTSCTGFKQKIEAFLSRPVFERDGIIYWFDGEPFDRLADNLQSGTTLERLEAPLDELHQNRLKAFTRLPAWLDHLIFDELNGRWDADHTKFESNLRSSQDDNLVYLGTYFPRSYAETFCIFDNLFSVECCHSRLEQNGTLSILSIGCGTGGDIIGLLTAILRNFKPFRDINVYAVDGNSHALSFLKTVFDRFCATTRCNAHLYVKQTVIDSFSIECFSDWTVQKFDFIVSCKMIGEIISGGNGTMDNAYYNFGMTFLPKLTASGLCLILDVTTKPSHSSLFFPQMMSAQLNRLMQEESDFAMLVPVCCSQYGRICHNSRCFQQKVFFVSHSHKNRDRCKVAYSIIARSSYVQGFNVGCTGKRMSVYEGTVCPFTIGFEEEVDPYQLCEA